MRRIGLPGLIVLLRRAAVRRAVGRRVLHRLALVPRARLRRRVPAHAERAGDRSSRDVRRRSSCSCYVNFAPRAARPFAGRRSSSAPARTAAPIVVEGRARWRARDAAVGGVVAGARVVGVGDDWLDWLSFFHAVPFGERDPLFGTRRRVLRLPAADLADGQRAGARRACLALIGCGLLLRAVGQLRHRAAVRRRVLAAGPADAGGAAAPGAARRASIFGLMAWGAWLDDSADCCSRRRRSSSARRTPTSTRGCRSSASTIAVLVLGAGARDLARLRPARLADSASRSRLYLVVSIAGGIYAGIVQRFIVTPNELEQGAAVHPEQHRGDARGVRARSRRRARAVAATRS